MAHNFQRPIIPYEGTSLQNDNRYQLLTAQREAIPFQVIDGENNYLIDALRQLDADIANLDAGILQGSDDPNNAGFLVTTDGAGNIGWIKIQDSNIVPESISRLSLIPGTITANEIADGTITALEIAPLTITGSQIAPATITINKMAPNSVGIGNIVNGAITTIKIEDGAVTTAKLAPLAVTTSKIAALAVTNAQIAAATILGINIAPNTITTGNILAATILGSNIAANTITLGNIANGVLTASASKAQQQAASSSTVYTSPATQQYHPSADSFNVNFVGATGSRNVSYNVSSVTRNSVGNYTINFTNNFAAAVFGVNITVTSPTGSGLGNPVSTVVLSRTSSSVTILTYIAGGSTVDFADVSVSGFGTLA